MEEAQRRMGLVDRLSAAVKQLYPRAQVKVFGSFATGLYLPKSDVDLQVFFPERNELDMMKRISNALVGTCTSIEQIKSAKVPIIKLQDKATLINVDISFNRSNGIYCVKLVQGLLRKYPELRPLLIVLKCFLKCRGLNEPYTGGIGSFLLTMLVTAFLQRQYKRRRTDRVDLGQHLLEFFEYYGKHFNLEHVGISIREGGFLFRKAQRGGHFTESVRNCKTSLSVENPQEPNTDLGKAAYSIRAIIRSFQHAYDTFCFNNTHSVSLLKLILTCDPRELHPNWAEEAARKGLQ